MSATLRGMWAAASVGFARVRARPGRTLLVLAGIAAATAMLVGVLGGSVITQNEALQRAISGLPQSQRTFRVDLLGLLLHQAYAQPERPALAALSQLSNGRPIRVAYLRDAWLDGEFVRLAGIDGLADHVRLRSGRLPRSCLPQRCEMLQIGNRGRRVLSEGGINLVRVGVGELRDRPVFGPAFAGLRRERAQRTVTTSTVLLLPNASSFARLPAVQLLFVVRSWIARLAPSDLRSWEVTNLLDRESRAQTELEQTDPQFALVAPDSALVDAHARGNVYRQRTILIGAVVAVVLLVFAMVAAAGLRRGMATERWRIVQRGATFKHVWLAAFAEIGTIALAGWLLGLVIGAVAIAVLAAARGLPAGAVVDHALLEWRAVVALLVTLGVAAGVVFAVTLIRERQVRFGRVRLLDVAAVGAAVAAALALTRGSLSADTLASGGGDTTLLLLLPGLVCFAGAVAAARLLGPLTRAVERLSRRRAPGTRLALLALARAPARTELAGGFLVVSIALALFATTYRSTLARGARDESGFAVPLDVTLAEGSHLVRPIDAAPTQRYERLSPGVHAYPILRLSADLPGIGTATQAVTVLGVPTPALARMYWRSDFSPASRSSLVGDVGRDGPTRLRGAVIPPGAESLRVRVRVSDVPVRLDLALEDARGRVTTMKLGVAHVGVSTLTVRVPLDTARRITGLQLSLPLARRNWYFHLANENRAVRAPTGTLELQPLRERNAAGRERVLDDWQSWTTQSQDASVEHGRRVRVSYSFTEAQTLFVRPREATDARPLRVIASPAVVRTAGAHGLLTLDFVDTQIPARVVATATRFPTLQPDEQFVVADETRLSTALDADDPGTGTPGELWLSAPHDGLVQQLDKPPFRELVQTSRRQLQRQVESDPLARGVEFTLAIAAIVALVLAAVGIWITLLSDLRDERGHFLDLEGQGVAPETLRNQLRIRALVLLCFGILGGVLVGLVLSRLVVSLVQVSAETSAPQPPLVTDTSSAAAWLLVAVLVVAVGIAAEVSARSAFAGETPKRAAWSLE